MAIVLPKISGRRLSATRKLAYRAEPALGLQFLTLQPAVEPLEKIEFEYSIQRVPPNLVDRLEVSVVWYTEGKGSEDLGVHLFQQIGREELAERDASGRACISVRLPAYPLSFEGRLLNIRWCVRLRLYLTDGREVSAEKPFYVGHLTTEL